MTTQIEPGSHREWRVNRIRTTLQRISTECGDPNLTRAAAQALAAALREVSLEMADVFVCPTCKHPEACTCTECPVGVLTARPPAS
jgi:hypothetical protein